MPDTKRKTDSHNEYTKEMKKKKKDDEKSPPNFCTLFLPFVYTFNVCPRVETLAAGTISFNYLN